MEVQEKKRLEELFGGFLNEDLEKISFGNPVDRENMHKVRVRPVILREMLVFQAEELRGKQAFHKNMTAEEAVHCFVGLLEKEFRQCELVSSAMWAQVLVSKKGTVTIKKKQLLKGCDGSGKAGVQKEAGVQKTEGMRKKAGMQKIEGVQKIEVPVSRRDLSRLQHNRTKRYILEEGVPVPFLIDLGVMTQEGKIIRAKYDKFRQINRFLEFIEDILPQLSREHENRIIDFGCGKSYLTFAMYYYLKELKGFPIQIIGLDLKEEVISHCNQLARKYHYDSLVFCTGDIASFDQKTVQHDVSFDQEAVRQKELFDQEAVRNDISRDGKVDMVVTLHACDTATDYALEKAVNWGARVILSVPCCQHELNNQIQNELMQPVLSYGLLKERLAALYTDGLRAEILEHMGYRTQILEFIDMEHTPKNLLIRAVKQGERRQNLREIREIMDFWHVEPTLARLLLADN